MSARILVFRGKELSIAEWARRLNIPRKTIESRLKSGWSIEETLGTPKLEHGIKHTDVIEYSEPVPDASASKGFRIGRSRIVPSLIEHDMQIERERKEFEERRKLVASGEVPQAKYPKSSRTYRTSSGCRFGWGEERYVESAD